VGWVFCLWHRSPDLCWFHRSGDLCHKTQSGGRPVFDLGAVQAAVREAGLDGWLLYDFRGTNVLAQRVADLAEKSLSRRWVYYVPATGEPKKLVHAIEPAALDHLPGTAKTVYRRWQDLETGVAELVIGAKRVAMEYS